MEYTLALGGGTLDVLYSHREIQPDWWNDLHITDCYHTEPWIKLGESRFEQDSRYIAVKDGSGRIQALAPCCRIRDPQIWPTYNLWKLFTKASFIQFEDLPGIDHAKFSTNAEYIDAAVGDKLFPNLICTAPEGFMTGPMYAYGLSPETINTVNTSIVDGLKQLGEELECAASSLLYVMEDSPIRSYLDQTDWIPMQMNPMAILDIKWKSFDEYLSSLSRKRRESTRREMKKFKESGMIVKQERLEDLPIDRTAELFHNVNAKHMGFDAGPVQHARYYIEGLLGLGLTHTVYAAYQNENLVAFSLFFLQDNTLFARVMGIDYERATDYSYFNLLFYRPIIDAIEQGVACIDFGGMLKAKLIRGCKPHRSFSYFKFGSEVCKDAQAIRAMRENADIISRYHDLVVS
ncbi:MAG: GNAT family N-acetyltransferase [Myxococcales bacterium]|nr:MAG: GNAT family N-acetyltransferase [Myxococcales bacterium]